MDLGVSFDWSLCMLPTARLFCVDTCPSCRPVPYQRKARDNAGAESNGRVTDAVEPDHGG